jgi:hypothetical protein
MITNSFLMRKLILDTNQPVDAICVAGLDVEVDVDKVDLSPSD